MTDAIDKVKQLILSTDKSFSTISKESGIPYPTLTHWIYKGGGLSASNIVLLCNYFNISADWLLGLEKKE